MTKTFEPREAVDALTRLLREVVSDGALSLPVTFALLAPNGLALTGIYRVENGRLLCQQTSGWLPGGSEFPPLLVGLFVDNRGETVLLRIDGEGQTRLLPADAKGPAPHLS